MIEILVPETPSDLDAVRTLMRAFIAWHRERHVQDLALIDAYFAAAAFEEELATLPGVYLPPSGDLLLARVAGDPAGCVAMRRLDAQTCEMKRMFVYPRFHGMGVGKALAQKLITDARAAGYSAMKLDTSIRQAEASGLYRHLGFETIPPYYEVSDRMREWLVFMALRL
jgi:putative acetyltransferase